MWIRPLALGSFISGHKVLFVHRDYIWTLGCRLSGEGFSSSCVHTSSRMLLLPVVGCSTWEKFSCFEVVSLKTIPQSYGLTKRASGRARVSYYWNEVACFRCGLDCGFVEARVAEDEDVVIWDEQSIAAAFSKLSVSLPGSFQDDASCSSCESKSTMVGYVRRQQKWLSSCKKPTNSVEIKAEEMKTSRLLVQYVKETNKINDSVKESVTDWGNIQPFFIVLWLLNHNTT